MFFVSFIMLNLESGNLKKNLKLSIDDFKKLINKKTKIVFLVNPNLPIEYEISDEDKKEILKICKKKI